MCFFFWNSFNCFDEIDRFLYNSREGRKKEILSFINKSEMFLVDSLKKGIKF